MAARLPASSEARYRHLLQQHVAVKLEDVVKSNITEPKEQSALCDRLHEAKRYVGARGASALNAVAEFLVTQRKINRRQMGWILRKARSELSLPKS